MAKSDVHVTSLVCISHPGGELYRIDKETFLQKVNAYTAFMRKLEKQCIENVRDQVRKIAFVKQNDEKQLESSGMTPSTAASDIDPTAAATTPRITEGINLRKEAAKIDVKQFDANDVNHVVPIIAVMRPPKALKDQHSISVNKSMPTPGSQSPVRGENVIAEEKLTNDQKKEAERQIDRYHRAWKRLRPNEAPGQSPERGEDEEE